MSISAALGGTIANKKTRKVRTIEDSKPKSWFFDVFEEPELVQNDRMNEWTLSQSAACMDVSDDDSKGKEHNDRGKENVDPNETAAPVTRSMAAAKAAADELKKDIMADDRSPLGDLNPADYYAEGLDATSVVLIQDYVPEEKETETTVNEAEVSVVVKTSGFTFESAELPQLEADLSTEDIGAVIKASVPNWEAVAERSPSHETKHSDALELPLQLSEDMEIWESESAKDENEKQEDRSIDDDVFALQEL